MYSYLVLAQDDPTIQIVNQAQKAYVEKVAPSVAAMAGLPILSAGTPFKAGGRKNNPTGYTHVNLGMAAAIAGAIGRTASPIAGVTIVCAGLAMVSPVEMVKRTAPGMILAVLFLALFML